MDDPRITNRGNYLHKFEDIGLYSIICGGEDFADMKDFGKKLEVFCANSLNSQIEFRAAIIQ